jgi:hypothetical protein
MTPPTAVTEDVGPNMFVPGLTAVVSPDFESKPLYTGTGPQSGIQVIREIEKAFQEVSPDVQSGIQAPGEQTRSEVELLSNNAETAQAIFRANIREFVYDITELMMSDAQQYITLPALNQFAQGASDVQTIILPQAVVSGKSVDQEIKFVNPMASVMDDDFTRSLKILNLEKKGRRRIFEVNPLLFLQVKFSVYPDPEQEAGDDQSTRMNKARELFSNLAADPYTDPQELRRYYIGAFAPSSVDRLVVGDDKLKQIQDAQRSAAQTGAGGTVGNVKAPRRGGADNLPTNPLARAPVV